VTSGYQSILDPGAADGATEDEVHSVALHLPPRPLNRAGIETVGRGTYGYGQHWWLYAQEPGILVIYHDRATILENLQRALEQLHVPTTTEKDKAGPRAIGIKELKTWSGWTPTTEKKDSLTERLLRALLTWIYMVPAGHEEVTFQLWDSSSTTSPVVSVTYPSLVTHAVVSTGILLFVSCSCFSGGVNDEPCRFEIGIGIGSWIGSWIEFCSRGRTTLVCRVPGGVQGTVLTVPQGVVLRP
jgi:hypothetical protein